MSADQMSRPQGVGDISVVPGVVLGMSMIRARIIAATLSVTAVLALPACGAVGLLPQDNAPAPPTTTATSAPSTTRTPAAVPTLPTKEPAPATEHIAEPTDPLTAEVYVIAEDIDKFWQSMTGEELDVDLVRSKGNVECGGTTDTLAVACFRDGETHQVRWSHDGFTKARRDGTLVAVALVLAHELGHTTLESTGNGPRDDSENARDERRADCLAGVYLSVSKLDLGMTPEVLWDRAFPATRAPNAKDSSERARKDAIRLGFTAKDDPLAFCIANA